MKYGFIFLTLFLAACTARTSIPLEFPIPPPAPVATPLSEFKTRTDTDLSKQFEEIAKAAKGKVGVAAVMLETGEAAFLSADERFPMQSVYKLPIAMALMDQVRLGKLDLEEKVAVTKDDMVRIGIHSPLRDKNPEGGEFTIRELINLSLVESDGTASDVLLQLVGGPQEVQNYLTQIGIRDIKVVDFEKDISRNWETQYENWATPTAAVELLRWLDASADHWKPSNFEQELSVNQLLLQFMFESTPGQKRIKGLIPLNSPISVVAHKTGTGGTKDRLSSATNDIGIVYLPNGKHLAIAVFVSDSPADARTRESVIARIAKAAWDRWSS